MCSIAAVAVLLPSVLWIAGGQRLGVVIAQKLAKNPPKAPLVLDRAPVRIIADPNPVFSGIAVDSKNDEVFITNDSEAGPSVLVYPTQFPPTESVIEPRRRIAGPKSRMELPCGVAVSPEYKEMYVATGDGQNVHVYPLDGNGDVPPLRQLDVPHDSGGVFWERKYDELFVTTEQVRFFGRKEGRDASPIQRYLVDGSSDHLTRRLVERKKWLAWRSGCSGWQKSSR